MQRYSLQRWSIVVLLIARLVLGELAHAAPHQNESNNADPAAVAHAQEVPCPDHATESDAQQAVTDWVDTGSHDTKCCQNACECACLHLSALAIPATVSAAALDRLLVVTAALGHTPEQIYLLFRPPA